MIIYLLVPGSVEITHDQLPFFVEANCSKVENQWVCNICGQTKSSKIDVTRHMEAKHVILPELICHICNKTSKTRHSLRVHMKNAHNQILNFEK